MDPTGMWINNEDGSFIAEKGDTLWGLQQETGKDWKSFDYQGKPEELQIGQRVNINTNDTDNNYSTVDSTSEAIKHYYNGNGSPVNLGNNSINILKNSSEFMYNKNALANGTAKSDVHRFGVDMTSQELGWRWWYLPCTTVKDQKRPIQKQVKLQQTEPQFHYYSTS